MEDIIISSARSNVVLPERKNEKVEVARDKAETKNKTENSKNESGKDARITVDLEKTVEKVKEFAKRYTTKLSFAVDPESRESIIYVTNKETGKIIRQIPPEDIQKINKKMDEIVGLLFSRRA